MTIRRLSLRNASGVTGGAGADEEALNRRAAEGDLALRPQL